MRGTNRRTVLKGALAGAGTLALAPLLARPGRALAADAPARVTKLTDKVSVVSGLGGNVVVHAAGADGLTLVDCGAPGRADALLRELTTLASGARVRTLFNTHRHLEQTGNNEALANSGAKIVAHEKCRLWIATDHWLPAEQRYEKARPKAAQPTDTFYTSGKTTAGTEKIEYGYLLEAHTDGDCYVFFRDSNVLAVGDAAAPERDPVLDWYGGGWLGGRLDALQLLIKLSNEQTRVVPSFGPVIGRKELQAEHDWLLPVFTKLAELMRKGYTTDAMIKDDVLAGMGRPFQDPKKFLYDAHKGFWAHHNTLSHDIV